MRACALLQIENQLTLSQSVQGGVPRPSGIVGRQQLLSPAVGLSIRAAVPGRD